MIDKKTIIKAAFVLLALSGMCLSCKLAQNSAGLQPEKPDANSVETVLKQLSRKTEELESYSSRIEYLFSQPSFESETLRKGVLHYASFGKESKLRINFETLKQDDEKQQKCVEHYIFDGVWLTRIDYQLEQVTMRQLTEPNEPVDAFELLSRNFPIVGFSKIEDLEKQFDIELVKQKAEEANSVIPAKAGIHEFIHLHLKVKPDSIYKDDYTSIDFWVDRKLWLPTKMIAVSTEPAEDEQKDIYQIRFLRPKINKKISKKTFDIKIPKGFTVEKNPLKKKD